MDANQTQNVSTALENEKDDLIFGGDRWIIYACLFSLFLLCIACWIHALWCRKEKEGIEVAVIKSEDLPS